MKDKQIFFTQWRIYLVLCWRILYDVGEMKPACFHEECTFGGFLLLASPQMRDLSFRRKAVLLQKHKRDCGACGFILDKPLNKQLWQVLPCSEEKNHPQLDVQLEQLPVYLGGPCGSHDLIIVSIEWQLDGRACVTCLSTLAQTRAALAQGMLVRVFVGYAAWSKGQLEQELHADSWVITPPKPSLLRQACRDSEAWSGHLRSMGAEMTLLSHIPQNPLAN